MGRPFFENVRDHRDLGRHLAAAACILGADAVLLLDQLGRVEFQFAELAGEGHVLLVIHRLVAEAQHQIVEPGSADRVAVGGAQRSSDVDPGNLGAKAGGERADGDAHRDHSAAARIGRMPKSLIDTRQWMRSSSGG